MDIFKSPGPDDVPNWVLKSYAPLLTRPITSVFNASIQFAYVPSRWKRAEVIPIPKVKNVSNLKEDLRPISLTQSLSKRCERFVPKRIISSIKDKIDNRQFGSLTNSSTTHALVTLVHHLLQETDVTGNSVRVFILDFSKAFDRIDYNILLGKLTAMDVPQISMNWVRSFLTSRKQRVKLNGFVSDWRAVNGGVPQSTALGPILFLVMVNDLLNDWKDRWKYVDDTSASETVTPQTNSTLQLPVDEVVSWTTRNKMKLNVSKCKELIVKFSKDKLSFAPLISCRSRGLGKNFGPYNTIWYEMA